MTPYKSGACKASEIRRCAGQYLPCAAVAVVMLFSSVSCSKSGDDTEIVDGIPPVEQPETPGADVDYAVLKKFIADAASAGDYCRTFSAAGTEFRIASVSGKSCNVNRNGVPYILVSSGGSVSVDGKAIRPESAPVISSVKEPSVSVAASGSLVVEGVDVGVRAGNSLRCVINARKHIYFCFADGTMTLGSEVFAPYNPALPTNARELNVLFIGNSFTVDATEHLPGMVTASGITNVNMTRLYHGGYTLPEYYSTFSTPDVCARYDYAPGDKSWSGSATLDDKPSDALAARDWDVIVIQEHTGRSEAWSWPGVLGPAVEGLREIFYNAHPTHRPTIVYLMAQTYSDNSTVLRTSFSNSREQMFQTTSSVVRQLMGETGIDVVISTGAVLENLRTSRINIDNGLQLTRDSYHMDFGISRYAASCAVFETLITPATGKKTDDCPYRYSTSSTESGKYSTPVTDDNAPVAQAAAHEAVKSPFAVTKITK